MAGSLVFFVVSVALFCVSTATNATSPDHIFSEFLNSSDAATPDGRWAVLIAGSKGWADYDDQADVCHAYQILVEGGLDKEHIIVLMYDDIASHPKNPRPNKIINRPYGPDVYSGVRVDYRGNDVTADNVIAVLYGDKDQIVGGNGRVLMSGQNDRVFIYYSGHGRTDFLSMPVGKDLAADDLVSALIWLNANQKYKSMVIYVQACKSGSIFENRLPAINVYAVTSASATEDSWRAYCDMPSYFRRPPEYDICLGTQFGVAWLEDWEKYSTDIRSLQDQYQEVRDRILPMDPSSHPTQFGDTTLARFSVATYMGRSYPRFGQTKDDHHDQIESYQSRYVTTCAEGNLYLIRNWVKTYPPGSPQYVEAKKELDDVLATIKRENDNFARIGIFLLNNKNSSEVVKNNNVKYTFNSCIKSLMDIYYKRCGKLSIYGLDHVDDLQNMCDAGVTESQLIEASTEVCSD